MKITKELMNYRPIRRLVKNHGMKAAEKHLQNPSFPIWVCIKMEQWGISQRELADKMGIHESLLSRLLSGERPVNVNHIKKLCYAFEVEAVEIWDLL